MKLRFVHGPGQASCKWNAPRNRVYQVNNAAFVNKERKLESCKYCSCVLCYENCVDNAREAFNGLCDADVKNLDKEKVKV